MITTYPNHLREAAARIEAWCSLIERPSPDGDESLTVDADVAAEHARDCRAILSLLTPSDQTEGHDGDWNPFTTMAPRPEGKRAAAFKRVEAAKNIQQADVEKGMALVSRSDLIDVFHHLWWVQGVALHFREKAEAAPSDQAEGQRLESHSTNGPKTIWLQPECCADIAGDGRQWCQDADVWEECEDQPHQHPTKYIRADIALPSDQANAEGWRPPEGWALVPQRATNEMIDAARGLCMFFNCMGGQTWTLGQHAESGGYGEGYAHLLTPEERAASHFPKADQAELIYRAMLAAAPPANPSREGA